jgi:hypothetical protein
MVEGFADAPRAALLFHLVLQVAACHVQAHGITVNVLGRVGGWDIPAAQADGHHQFDFVVQVVGEAGVRHGAGLAGFDHDQTVSRLEEKEGRFATGEPHFFGVFLIVTANAVNAVNWEAVRVSHYGN